MGRTTTPKYAVSLFVPGFNYTPMAWRVATRGRARGYGMPTDANLAKWIKDFEEDCRTGANKHLGEQTVERAVIIRQSDRKVVASYLRTPLPTNDQTRLIERIGSNPAYARIHCEPQANGNIIVQCYGADGKLLQNTIAYRHPTTRELRDGETS
jgi:hypothetical protein